MHPSSHLHIQAKLRMELERKGKELEKAKKEREKAMEEREQAVVSGCSLQACGAWNEIG